MNEMKKELCIAMGPELVVVIAFGNVPPGFVQVAPGSVTGD
jgi:hypothetical protein